MTRARERLDVRTALRDRDDVVQGQFAASDHHAAQVADELVASRDFQQVNRLGRDAGKSCASERVLADRLGADGGVFDVPNPLDLTLSLRILSSNPFAFLAPLAPIGSLPSGGNLPMRLIRLPALRECFAMLKPIPAVVLLEALGVLLMPSLVQQSDALRVVLSPLAGDIAVLLGVTWIKLALATIHAFAATTITPVGLRLPAIESVERQRFAARSARLHRRASRYWSTILRTSSATEMPSRLASARRNSACGSVKEIICFRIPTVYHRSLPV
jgi:hypothetical protein